MRPRPPLPPLLAALLAALAVPACRSAAGPQSIAPGPLAPAPPGDPLAALLGPFDVTALQRAYPGAAPAERRGRLVGQWDPELGGVLLSGDLDGRPVELLVARDRRDAWLCSWRRPDGSALLALAEGHRQPDGALLFVRGGLRPSRDRLALEPEGLTLEHRPLGPDGPWTAWRLECRRRPRP